MKAGTWTEDEVQTLRALLEKGMRTAEIARHMRTNYYRIKDKIKTLKDARKLERRNIERNRTAPGHYARRAGRGVERVERHCLCCGVKFVAEGRYLRLCPDHRRASW